ncbi:MULTISPECIES: hypothetical protein [unclassified Bradyrhizobium]|uniref:hypothetical protein n=1 Tax=unclassified Bradyrhizobium TaxID=2631580 RepID=UPI002915DDFE|nr:MULTISPECIES: hypothetical protein [unclassified Bradyrhizobium]
MPRKIDLTKLKQRAHKEIKSLLDRIQHAEDSKFDYLLIRWMSAMTAVELHGIWERYAENRIVAGLNHDSSHFICEEAISGVSHVTVGLASFIVRGGNKYFDFRSMADLISKADRWMGPSQKNPFRSLTVHDRNYIDALAAIRNCVVHGSDAARSTYRTKLKSVYGILYTPEPDEFLNAKDSRAVSPLRYQTRLKGIASVIQRSIAQS